MSHFILLGLFAWSVVAQTTSSDSESSVSLTSSGIETSSSVTYAHHRMVSFEYGSDSNDSVEVDVRTSPNTGKCDHEDAPDTTSSEEITSGSGTSIRSPQQCSQDTAHSNTVNSDTMDKEDLSSTHTNPGTDCDLDASNASNKPRMNDIIYVTRYTSSSDTSSSSSTAPCACPNIPLPSVATVTESTVDVTTVYATSLMPCTEGSTVYSTEISTETVTNVITETVTYSPSEGLTATLTVTETTNNVNPYGQGLTTRSGQDTPIYTACDYQKPYGTGYVEGAQWGYNLGYKDCSQGKPSVAPVFVSGELPIPLAPQTPLPLTPATPRATIAPSPLVPPSIPSLASSQTLTLVPTPSKPLLPDPFHPRPQLQTQLAPAVEPNGVQFTTISYFIPFGAAPYNYGGNFPPANGNAAPFPLETAAICQS